MLGNRSRFFAFLLSATVLTELGTLPGCGGDNPVKPFGNTINQLTRDMDHAIELIDNATREISSQSTKWQSIVQELGVKFPKDVDHLVHDELSQLAERSVAKAGTEFRCNVDFLANRAKQWLSRIKTQLLVKLGRSTGIPEQIPPEFCQVIPSHSEYDPVADKRNDVTFYGYDMDIPDSQGKLVQFLLFSDATKEYIPLEPDKVGRTTHYQIGIKLQGDGFERLLRQKKISKVRCSWNGQVQVTPEVLVSVQGPPHESTVVSLGSITHVPRWVAGDRDFDVKGDYPMHVQVAGESRVANGNKIETRAYMHAKEHGDDWTEVGSWSNEVQTGMVQKNFGMFKLPDPKYGDGPWQTAYTAPQGWKIIHVQPMGRTDASTDIGDHNIRMINRPEGEAVKLFQIWGDTSDDEAGTYTRVQVQFSDVRVKLEKVLDPDK